MGERFGSYELVRRIAQGGMAEVFLARFCGVEGFERWVVIKKMLPELAVRKDFVEMFLDEARLAARFNHPNIVQVYELGEKDGAYFMAMEYVDGPHLGSLFAHSLRIKKPLPIPLCCFVLARASEGLHHAHELKSPDGTPLQIVHRDVSPQNILVSRQGDVKVMDFGVAKATTQSVHTRTGVVKGKVSYMSPEQCLAQSVDRRTDVFALGVVLYELVTRRRLFRDKSDLLVMQRITSQDVPLPSSVNPRVTKELDDVIMAALVRDQAKRVPDALHLSDLLDSYLVGMPDPPTRTTLSRWIQDHAAGLGPGADSASAPTPSWPTGGSGVSRKSSATVAPVPENTPVDAEAPPVEEGLPDAPAPGEALDPGQPDPGEGFMHTSSVMTPAQQRLVVGAGSVVTAAVVAVAAWLLLSRGAEPVAVPGASSGGVAAAAVSGAAVVAPSSAGVPVASSGGGGAEEPREAPVLGGALRLMTEPPGAEVTVNGVGRGRSGVVPLVVRDLVADKPVSVVVTLEGYDTVRMDVPLAPGETSTLPVIRMRKVTVAGPKVAIYDVSSDPSGLRVIVDGKPVGRTPLTGLELREGGHSVVVEPPPGYVAARDSIRARPGTRAPLHYVLGKQAAAPPPRDPGPAPVQTGRFFVDSIPWTNVSLGKKVLGPVPVSAEAPAGQVTIRLTRNAEGCVIDAHRVLDVPPGGTARKSFQIEPKEIKGKCE